VFAADPSADVDGWDAQSKLVLLARLAYGVTLSTAEVPTTGISIVSKADFDHAKSIGHTIKLLGVARTDSPGTITAFVSPMLIPLTMDVARVSGPTNIIKVPSTFSA
jgi:homoserine dehydrogenase